MRITFFHGNGNIYDVNPAVKDSIIYNMNNQFDPGTKAEETQEQATEATEQATEEKAEGQGALVD